MKTPFKNKWALFCLLSYLSIQLTAQNCVDLLGITSPAITNLAPVRIDTLTGDLGELTNIFSVPQLIIDLGTTTIDANNKRLFFIHTSNVATFLKTVSSVTGNQLVNPSPSIENIYELQYHCANETLFALETNAMGSAATLVQIDEVSGNTTAVSGTINFDPGFGLYTGSSTIDSQNDRYFFIAATADAITDYRLYVIDTNTGTVNSFLLTFGVDYVDMEYNLFTDELILLTPLFEIVKINPATGATLSTSAALPVGSPFIQIGNTAIDPFSDKLYFVASPSVGDFSLYTVNTNTSTLIGSPLPLGAEVVELTSAIPCDAVPDFEFENTCEGEEAQFLDASVGALGWMWTFDDPGSGAANMSTEQNPVHTFSTDGIFNVTLQIEGCVGLANATVTKAVEVSQLADVDLGPDITDCSASVTLDAGAFPGASYFWITGDNTQTITASASADYWVQVTIGNCTKTDTINVTLGEGLVNLGDDLSACEGDVITLDSGFPGAAYTWSPNGETTESITVTDSGIYSVEVVDGLCVLEDEIEVTFLNAPTVDLGPDMEVCAASIDLDAGISGATYLWSPNGETTQTITVTTSDTYSVEVMVGTCSASDEIVIDILGETIVELGGDLTGNLTQCETEPLVLDATTAGATYLWSPNGETSPTINVTTSGTYSVEVSVGSCMATDMVNVTLSPEIVLDLGEDVTLCESSAIELTTGLTGVNHDWSTGETSAAITVNTADTYSVTVSNGGCMATDEIVVAIRDIEPIDLGPDQAICPVLNDVVTLDAGPGASYLWMPTGETSRQIMVTEPDAYSVEVTDDIGCTSTGDIVINSQCAVGFVIPTAFSPNDDGINDVFRPRTQFVFNYTLRIFNRWGESVFETNDLNDGWDGTISRKNAPSGVYVWVATFTDQDNNPVTEKGNLTLVR